ncbi:sulfotransferase family protein, partial [Metapseudomonas otitidis]|uniref:sulfotransferase family protein n=1 Tax=Metapseudomonas otitidis TaxID=319939 RepID=UPI0008EF3653
MSPPVKTAFIVGTGRCGTSWLGQMLNSHTEICVPPEIQLLFEYSDNGNRLTEAFSLATSSELDSKNLVKIIEQGCPHKLEMFFDYHEFCNREDTPKGSLREFVTSFYSAIAERHGKSWLIEQTPWYGSRLDLLCSFFPEAKVIHMIRDGRDVALSFTRTPWWHTSPRLNLARWQREIKKIALDATLYFNSSSYLEVKYEDLASNTESEMRRICAFLGVDFDPKMLDPSNFIDYDQFCKFDMQQISSQAYNSWQKRKDTAVFMENVQAWRRNEDIFHPPLPEDIECWLRRYGYEVGAQVPDELDIAQYHRGYSFSAIEALQSSQLDRIQVLEEALKGQAEHLATFKQDWAARGEYIEHLAQTIDTLRNALQKQAGQAELIEQDWAARGEHIEHLAQTID